MPEPKKLQHYEITISGHTFSFDGPPGLSKEQARDVVKAKLQPYGEPGRVADQLGLGAASGLLEQGPTTLSMGGGPASEAWRHLVRKAMPELDRSKGLHAPQGVGENVARTTGEFLGNPATYAGAEGAAGITGRVVDAVLGAVGTEGVRQIMEQADANPILSGIAEYLGGIVGPAGRNPLAEGFPRSRSDPIHDQMVRTLEDKYKIFPTAADVRNSKPLRKLETTAGALPGSFGAAEKASERVGAEVANALLRMMGDTTTDMREGKVDFGDALIAIKERLQGRLDNAANKLPIEFDKTLSDSMTNVLRAAQAERQTPEVINRIQGMIEKITNGFQEQGRKPPVESTFNFEGQSMPVDMRQGKARMQGKTYQSLTRFNGDLTRMQKHENSDISHYGDLLRTALDDAMERTVTKAAQSARPGRGTGASPSQRNAAELENAMLDLKEARQQWYTMLITAKAFAGPGTESAHGRISAQKLKALVTATSDDKLKYAFQRSNIDPEKSDLNELARMASGVITNLANSTTSERGYQMHVLEGLGRRIAEIGVNPSIYTGSAAMLGTGHPLIAASLFTPGLAGKALLSDTVQDILKKDRPEKGATAPIWKAGAVAATNINANEDKNREHKGSPPLFTSANAAEGPHLPGELGPVRAEAPGEGGGFIGPPEKATGGYKSSDLKKLKSLMDEGRSWAEIASEFPGRSMDSLGNVARRQYGPRPKIEEQPPEGMEPGWSGKILNKARPRIVVRPEGAGSDPGDISTTQEALDNAPP